ncbi:glycosyltransferase family 2 protein [Verrucomicrobiaceae bacterium N1E253]|uniref:Glycosyltransferase family 2 protein n=1 Tax=Oceaniferula marina TaxID=2748318 RepID=A0A851GRH5_9BACT|nr:glycosyltransferase family 2 protein [Oceaniferula marina]NWK56814.1 glycosyltransferase family 2 protein [Oceaniferula marina]
MNHDHYTLAPIGVSTYTRLTHLKQTIEALSQNTLAKQSKLYIFSDAPMEGDENAVSTLRSYLETIDGFESVTIVARTKNNRIKNNRGGMRQLLDEYGKLIWLEDDIVTAPGFLCYMNEALEFYKDDPQVLSICGYAPPLKVRSQSDAFILSRFSAWGFGITASNFDKIKAIPSNALETLDRARLIQNGRDLEGMVKREASGKINALDIRAMYAQYLNSTVTVYPKQSLVQNIGHDGTGVHCGNSSEFHHKELWQQTDGFSFVKNPELDPRIVKANARWRNNMKRKRKLYRKLGLKRLAKFLNNTI